MHTLNIIAPPVYDTPPPDRASATAPGRRHDAILPMNTLLQVGDHIVSDNGLFFAILRSDGNFGVYRGIDIDPDHPPLWSSNRYSRAGAYFALVQADGNFCVYRGADLSRNEGWLWGTQATASGGQFYAAMQDDGNFCIRKGHGPADCAGLVWASGATDRVHRIDEILDISYDLGAAHVMRTSPASLYSETLSNTTPHAVTSTLAGSVTVTETSGWTDAFAVRHGGVTRFIPGIPIVAGDEVVMAAAADMGYIWNGASTTTKDWDYRTEVSVPAGVALRAVVSATYSTIAVPYTLIGRLTFESGVQVVGTVRGVYMGCNAHDLTAAFTPLDAKPNDGSRITRALTPFQAQG